MIAKIQKPPSGSDVDAFLVSDETCALTFYAAPTETLAKHFGPGVDKVYAEIHVTQTRKQVAFEVIRIVEDQPW